MWFLYLALWCWYLFIISYWLNYKQVKRINQVIYKLFRLFIVGKICLRFQSFKKNIQRPNIIAYLIKSDKISPIWNTVHRKHVKTFQIKLLKELVLFYDTNINLRANLRDENAFMTTLLHITRFICRLYLDYRIGLSRNAAFLFEKYSVGLKCAATFWWFTDGSLQYWRKFLATATRGDGRCKICFKWAKYKIISNVLSFLQLLDGATNQY